MSDAWAVLLAGIGGFGLAYALLRVREQGRGADKEFLLWRKDMRKMALMITNCTPRQYGGCAKNESAHMAVAKLRQLHTCLAVRLSPEDQTGVKLLSGLNKLIADIDCGKDGKESHAEVVRLFSALLSDQKQARKIAVVNPFSEFFRWLYELPEYLTDYDRERKTN